MKIAVVGGGVIGACTAWALQKRGHEVTLFEKDEPISHTSRSSSKLLHGGLRYLETGQFSLVKKALQARRYWIEKAPEICHPLKLWFPIYKGQGRPKWQVGLGLRIYDFLARGSGFPKAQWVSVDEMKKIYPSLSTQGLQGAYAFYDAQMDDAQLGKWVIEQTQSLGTIIKSHHEVKTLEELKEFDGIVNAAGPWVMTLRSQQPGAAGHQIDWVRGSHLLINQTCPQSLMLQVPNEKRIFFVLPYHDQTLIGTTEVRQDHPESDPPSDQEIDYLLKAYNAYHSKPLTRQDIASTFSGVRPLLKTADNPSNAKREWAFESIGNVLHVYGGKWTTAQIQGEIAADKILAQLTK
ncbi:glycerol-3-phosphate dehydrogenase/oxidase [Basilea psittacipulmonis]|uniref:FAD-dependent oxidoreductase n=1 Tax=Basilea psittacipulmonis DSM 24701 TaxID=1072685 RepID=A0A077DFW3_9BURK|nr:glycerol-3-phosphate dehydrogenase/oxidase [Basilea psittacipulmonis]AIL32262.1 FAD-dependent oxidoreductase [Basilea psittacipulmonis DSM 24701]